MRLRCHRCSRDHQRLYLYQRRVLCLGCLKRARRAPSAVLARLAGYLQSRWEDWRHPL